MLDKAFRLWLTSFLFRIARLYPETFIGLLRDLELKDIEERVIIDRYMNKWKWDSFDYVDPRTAKKYNATFIDKFISRQKQR